MISPLRAVLLVGAILAAAAPGVARSPGADPVGLVKRMGLKLGHWATRITIDSIDLAPSDPAKPLSPDAAANLAAQRGRTNDTDDCLGELPAANGALILPGISLAADCRYPSIDTTGGRLRMTSICGKDAVASTSLTLDENYTPDRMTGTMTVKTASAGINVTLGMKLASRYVGKMCPLKRPA